MRYFDLLADIKTEEDWIAKYKTKFEKKKKTLLERARSHCKQRIVGFLYGQYWCQLEYLPKWHLEAPFSVIMSKTNWYSTNPGRTGFHILETVAPHHTCNSISPLHLPPQACTTCFFCNLDPRRDNLGIKWHATMSRFIYTSIFITPNWGL